MFFKFGIGYPATSIREAMDRMSAGMIEALKAFAVDKPFWRFLGFGVTTVAPYLRIARRPLIKGHEKKKDVKGAGGFLFRESGR